MSDYSENYLKEFLEITKIHGRNSDSVYHLFKQKTVTEISELMNQLIELNESHFTRNIGNIQHDISKVRGPVCTHNSWGNYLILEKIALYQEKVILEDFIQYDLHENLINPCTYNLYELSRSLSDYNRLLKWIELGFVDLFPSPRTSQEFNEILYDNAETLSNNILAQMSSEQPKSLRKFIEEEILLDESLNTISALYISSLTDDCLPLMDSPIMNKMIGQYMLEYSDYKPMSALLQLSIDQFSYISRRTPEDIFKIRESSKNSFENFREVWGTLIQDVKKEPWEEGFEEEINTLWDTEVVPEINSVEKDLTRIRRELGTSILLPIPGIISTLKNGSLLGVIETIATVAGLYKEICEYRKEKEKLNNNFAYIFYKLQRD